MSTKLTIFLGAFFLAIAFWACGDGSISSPSEEDRYYVYKMSENMEGLLDLVRESCEADSACRARVELAGGWLADTNAYSSSVEESSSDMQLGVSSDASIESSSKEEGPVAPDKDASSGSVKPEDPKEKSSSSAGPLPPEPPKKEESSSSKMGPPNPESSSSKVVPPDPKSSSEQPKSSSSSKPKSSSSSAEPLEPFEGTCTADRTNATTDETLTWNLEIPEGHENRGKFKWHFDDDAVIVTDVEKDYRVTDVKIKGSSVEGNGKVPNSITVHYTKPGNKTGTFVSLGGEKVLCNSQKISITAGQGMQESSSSESSSSESSSSNPGGPGVLDDDKSSSSSSESLQNPNVHDFEEFNVNTNGNLTSGVYNIKSITSGGSKFENQVVCQIKSTDKNANTFFGSDVSWKQSWDGGGQLKFLIPVTITIPGNSSLEITNCWQE